jgi:hypothetical protein
MPDPIADRPYESPLGTVRSALADPPAGDLAAPILARNLGELTRRLARARERGGRYSCLDFSPHVRDLVCRLDAGRSIPGAEKVH